MTVLHYKRTVEKILHQDVQIRPYEDVKRLPLAYRSGYSLNLMSIGGHKALVAAPTEKIPLAILRKQQHQMELYAGLPCVLYLKDMNYYSRDAMLREGIPFVWEGHQIYLPFIGTLLDEHQRQVILTCSQISYLTQKMLLAALYQGWQRVTVTKAAELLSVSKMSITRCFDELEALNIPYLTVRNRARNFSADKDKKAMWEVIRPILRNPVIKTYSFRKEPDITLPLSGTTALAHYSMLDEGAFPTYAITKKNLAELDISANILIPAGELPGCVIQELGYLIAWEDGIIVDPLTVVLSISEDELSDPRINIAVDEMLEEYVW